MPLCSSVVLKACGREKEYSTTNRAATTTIHSRRGKKKRRKKANNHSNRRIKIRAGSCLCAASTQRGAEAQQGECTACQALFARSNSAGTGEMMSDRSWESVISSLWRVQCRAKRVQQMQVYPRRPQQQEPSFVIPCLEPSASPSDQPPSSYEPLSARLKKLADLLARLARPSSSGRFVRAEKNTGGSISTRFRSCFAHLLFLLYLPI